MLYRLNLRARSSCACINCKKASVDALGGVVGSSCVGSFAVSVGSDGGDCCSAGLVNFSKDCKKLARPKLSKAKSSPFLKFQ